MGSKRKLTRNITRRGLDDIWRDTIRRRDKFRCQICSRGIKSAKGHEGATGNVHHIVGKRSNRARWDTFNGILLCVGCHMGGVHSPDSIRSSDYIGRLRRVIGEDRWAYLERLRADTRKRSLAEIEEELKRMK